MKIIDQRKLNPLAISAVTVTLLLALITYPLHGQSWAASVLIFAFMGIEIYLQMEIVMSLRFSAEELGKAAFRVIFASLTPLVALAIFGSTAAILTSGIILALVSYKLAKTLTAYMEKYDEIRNFHKFFQ